MAEQNLIDTFAHALRQIGDLFRTTVSVVKAQLRQDGAKLGTGLALMACALVFLLGVIPLLVLALVQGLIELEIPPWAAYLIVAGAVVLIATGLAAAGRLLIKRAAASLGETAGLVKGSITSLGGTPPPAPDSGDQPTDTSGVPRDTAPGRE
jgi:hypothetical protein